MKLTASFVILVVLSLFCINCCSTQYLKPTSVQLAKKSIDNTVALMNDVDVVPELRSIYPDKVSADKKHIPSALCSGVWVSQDVVLTANHCVVGYASQVKLKKAIDYLIAQMGVETLSKEEPSVLLFLAQMVGVDVDPMSVEIPISVQDEISDPGQMPDMMHTTKVLAMYPSVDLAYLQVVHKRPYPHHGVATVAFSHPPVGTEVAISGHPNGEIWSFRKGMISAYRGDMKNDGIPDVEGPFMQVNVSIFGGDSGGPVFDANTGELIGILSRMSTEVSCMAYAIDLASIRKTMIGQHLMMAVLDLNAPDPSYDNAPVVDASVGMEPADDGSN